MNRNILLDVAESLEKEKLIEEIPHTMALLAGEIEK